MWRVQICGDLCTDDFGRCASSRRAHLEPRNPWNGCSISAEEGSAFKGGKRRPSTLDSWSHHGGVPWTSFQREIQELYFERIPCTTDRWSISERNEIKKGISIGCRTNLWEVWRPFLALPIDGKMYNAFEKCLSFQKTDCFQTVNDVLQAITPLITLSPVSHLKQRASAGIQIDRGWYDPSTRKKCVPCATAA